MLKERHALAKLRAELEERERKLCRCYRKFRHLAYNCRNERREKKGTAIPQNKFEVLSNRIMQYGVEKRVVRSIRMVAVKCFKCGEEGHKYRKYPLWIKKERAVCVANPQKVQQGRRLARPVRKKAQEEVRKLRRVKEDETAHPAKGKAQQEWRRSLWETLRKRAKWYCGLIVPQDVELWELEWRGQGTIITYLKCPRCGSG